LNNSSDIRRRSWNPFHSVPSALGFLMGVASLISLIQRWTGAEIIAAIARDGLSIYRQMMGAFHWALFDWWTPVQLPWGFVFEMPLWGMDLSVVWIITAWANYRELLYFTNGRPGVLQAPWRNPLQFFRGFLFKRIIPAPFYWLSKLWLHIRMLGSGLIGIVFGKPSVRDINEDYIRIGFSASAIGLLPVLFVLLFFIWNAIQITPQ